MKDPKEYQDELKEAPFLRKLRQEGLAQPPPPDETYFADFAVRMQVCLEDEELLKQAPTLTEAGRQLDLAIPKGYFETLTDRILQRIQGEGKSAPIHSLGTGQARYAWMGVAIAAAIGLLLLLQQRRPSQAATYADWNSIPTEQLIAMAEVEVHAYSLMEEFGIDEENENIPLSPEEDLEDMLLDDIPLSELEDMLFEAEGE